MINEPRFVAIEHAIEAKREKLVPVALLNKLLAMILTLGVIHIKQVAQPLIIVVATSHVTLFLGYDFPTVLHYERTLRNVLPRNHAPHDSWALFKPLHLQFVVLEIFLLHQIVKAGVLIAAATRVTLTEAKDFVDTVGCSVLCDDDLTCFRAKLLLISGIVQFVVLSVAQTLFRVRTTIWTRTKTTPLHFVDIPLHVSIHRDILIDILHTQERELFLERASHLHATAHYYSLSGRVEHCRLSLSRLVHWSVCLCLLRGMAGLCLVWIGVRLGI